MILAFAFKEQVKQVHIKEKVEEALKTVRKILEIEITIFEVSSSNKTPIYIINNISFSLGYETKQVAQKATIAHLRASS